MQSHPYYPYFKQIVFILVKRKILPNSMGILANCTRCPRRRPPEWVSQVLSQITPFPVQGKHIFLGRDKICCPPKPALLFAQAAVSVSQKQTIGLFTSWVQPGPPACAVVPSTIFLPMAPMSSQLASLVRPEALLLTHSRIFKCKLRSVASSLTSHASSPLFL